MGFFDRFKNQTEPLTLDQLNGMFRHDENEIGSEKLNSATYYACMQIRCNAIAKLPLKVMEEKTDSAEVAKSHPLFPLLHDRPNSYMTIHDFLWATEFQRLHHGNAFWYPCVDSKGRVVSLQILPTKQVNILLDEERILDGEHDYYYQYSDLKKGVLTFFPEEILHFKNFAMNGIVGKSVACYLEETIDNERRANRILRNKYKSGLQDPVIVQYVGDLNDEKKRKVQKKFEALGGSEKAGQVVPIPTDFKVSQLETRLVNSQFFELQGLTTKHIANAFGVKSFQLNDMERSTYTNIENQNYSFYSDTLINVLRSYEQEIQYKLLQSRGKRRFFAEFNVDSLLRADVETRYKTYQTGISSGFLTVAEAREKENLPHIDGTDQLIYGNGAAIPFDKIGDQYDSIAQNSVSSDAKASERR